MNKTGYPKILLKLGRWVSNALGLRVVRADRLERRLVEVKVYKKAVADALRGDRLKSVAELEHDVEGQLSPTGLLPVHTSGSTTENSRPSDEPTLRNSRLQLQVEHFSVEQANLYELLICTVSDDPSDRSALAEISFTRKGGGKLSSSVEGLAASDAFENYSYVESRGAGVAGASVCAFRAPDGAVSCTVVVRPWKEATVEVRSVQLRPLVERIEYDPNSNYSSFWFQLADRYLLELGEPVLRRQVLLGSLLESGEAGLQKLQTLDAQLKELNVGWLPPLPERACIKRRAEDRLTVAHLHKVSYPYENSGGATRNTNIVAMQKQMGFDPYVVTPLWYPSSEGERELVWSEELVGVEHFRLTPPGKNPRSLNVIETLEYDTWITSSVLERRGVDLIHAASGTRGYELALKGLALAKAFTVPLVYEVRSFHEHTWGSAAHIDSELTRLRMAQEDRCMHAADAVVTISQSMADALVERGLAAERITVVPNAVDLGLFSFSPSSEPAKLKLGLKDKKVVGYVSNMSWREGHDVLLHAVARLRHNFSNLHCLLVGDGSERQRLERLVDELGIREDVSFIGEVDHADVVSYYEAIDIFVVPRRPDYAADYVTPMKPYEVMAVGRPLIVSDRPVSREVVGNDQQRGLMFRTGDDQHLAEQVTLLLNDRFRRDEIVRTARQWILEERTWSRVCEAYEGLYTRLIDSRRTAT